MSMIDTGVVVFAGAAFYRLLELLYDPDIASCTTGHAFQYHHVDKLADNSDLQLDLYSDLLLSFSLTRGPLSFEDYLEKVGLEAVVESVRIGILSNYQNSTKKRDRSLAKVWELCHDIPLHVIAIFNGIFLHLGTSSEYLDLVTTFSDDSIDHSSILTQRSKHLTAMKSKFECQSVISSFVEMESMMESTIVGSVLSSHGPGNCSIGKASFVEYSVINGDFSVGSGCILSHISDTFGQNLIAYDHMMIQQVPLAMDAVMKLPLASELIDRNVEELLVHIVLGVKDDVKAHYVHGNATICGVPWSHFFLVRLQIQFSW